MAQIDLSLLVTGIGAIVNSPVNGRYPPEPFPEGEGDPDAAAWKMFMSESPLHTTEHPGSYYVADRAIVVIRPGVIAVVGETDDEGSKWFVERHIPVTRRLSVSVVPSGDHGAVFASWKSVFDPLVAVSAFRGAFFIFGPSRYENRVLRVASLAKASPASFMLRQRAYINRHVQRFVVIRLYSVPPPREEEAEIEVVRRTPLGLGTPDDVCAICYASAPDAGTEPCGHVVMCSDCAREYVSRGYKHCAICRADIRRVIVSR